MTHTNRGRVIVDPAGPWRLYVRAPPDGMRILGTVQRGQTIGALCVDSMGLYWSAHGRTLDRLVDRTLAAALAQLRTEPGPP